MSNAAIAGLAIATLLIGAGIGYWLARLGTNKESAKRDEVEKEFETYRETVNEHFSTTASHFQSLGQQYRELYKHMAAGSQALCSPKDGELALPFGASDVIGIDVIDPEETTETETQVAAEPAEREEHSESTSPDQPPADYAPVEAADEPVEVETLDTAAASEGNSNGADDEPPPDPLPKTEPESTDRTLH